MTALSLNPLQLSACATGCSDAHLVDFANHRIHVGIVDDFIALQNAAKQAGFELTIASSFRDFERQSTIWNAKFSGARPVLNKDQQPVDLSTLSELDICNAILLYSALPGASRHHFGTDVDIFDQAAIKQGYKLQLEPHEYEDEGPFAAMTTWLNDNLVKFGFYRPYEKDLGGVAPEPWHISHIEQSHIMCEAINIEVLSKLIQQSDLLGKQTILTHLPELFERYVTNVSAPI
ncbi:MULTISPECIES: M15 family metallopeptidase [unclassified Pseudoalteromonas]|uniref:M15 family metallopeptidase n=1 Tax=unclassified Pseudoalteromonas TaxID=194690 RepID=UPI000B3D0AE5|nr:MULTISPECIES: M15 family metallopeptidase [unclassified Pseudoalteromonas]MDN3377346.1 M15 family metallopeptidase [Pseudoalteromonas sp. APC 3893]MDN3385486.1 M15 family metallopeptidase [Pseudoalteromonas sp. APC 4017]OUS68352.1 peptidase M15 [Pseudoalteromonas sp. A601]